MLIRIKCCAFDAPIKTFGRECEVPEGAKYRSFRRAFPLFCGKAALPPPVFAGGESADRKTVARIRGNSAHVEIFAGAWQTTLYIR